MTKGSIIKLLGCLVVVFMAIIVTFESRRNENIINSIPTARKMIALTFDDGPHPVNTPRLLSMLNKYHIRATFFMIGAAMKKYPFIVQQVIAKGHSIGNHTYKHPLDMRICSNSEITKEIKDCESVIREFTGKRPFFFRPPRGFLNLRVVQIAKKSGYEVVLWSVCGDRRKIKDSRAMARRVVKKIRPGDIILLHDGTSDSRWKDVEATQYIIEVLLKKGYQFVTVPQLIGS